MPATDLLVRVQVFTATDQAEARTHLFDVDASIGGSPPVPPSPGALPEVHVFDPPDHDGTSVPVRLLAKNDDNAWINMDVEFDAGQGWQPASPARGSDFMTNLAAPSVSAPYRFLWDAATDLPQGGSVRMRLSPYMGGSQGQPITTRSFQVSIVPPAGPPALAVPIPLSTLTVSKETGDNQHGLALMLMPDVLTVKVLGPSGPLAGVRVSFDARAVGLAVGREDDPAFATTTDINGVAGIRVRPGPVTATTVFQVVATVVGVPVAQTTFNLTAAPPAIVTDPSTPSLPVRYGETFDYQSYLDGDGDTNTIDFMPEPDRPVDFELPGHNCELDLHHAYLPGVGARGANAIIVAMTPTVLGGPASTDFIEFEVRVPADPAIAPVRVRRPVDTPVNARHLQSANAVQRVYQDLQVHLTPQSGLDPATGGPQKGYPGATLATPFEVRVKDQLGNTYLNAINAADANRCILGSVALEDLLIKWTCRSGVLSETMDRGNNDLELVVRYDVPVFFTPLDDGPWQVSATIDSPYVYDHRSRLHTWINSSGGRDCAMQAGLGVHTRRNFHIQIPESFEIVDTASNIALPTLKAGTLVRVFARGLSPYAANASFEPVDIRSLRADASDPRAYTNYAWPFRNSTLAVTPAAPDTLATDEILIVRGDPQNAAGLAPHALAILPAAWVRAEVKNIQVDVPTAALKRERLAVNGVSAMYEAPTGATPRGGAGGTVVIPTGDFVYGASDLNFRSRSTSVEMNRHYRHQLVSRSKADDTAEPLGPGWFRRVLRIPRSGTPSPAMVGRQRPLR